MYTQKHVYTYTYKYTVMRMEIVASILVHDIYMYDTVYEHVYIVR